jgi:hypothetical protein
MARLDLIADLVDEEVSGDARGTDRDGESWANRHGIPVKKFPADWNGPHKKQAGFVRNEEMACYATHLAVFPGGRGTADMVERAKAHGLTIWDYRPAFTGETCVVKYGEPFDVDIRRPGKWGNPFVIGVDGSRKTVIQRYRSWLHRQPELMISLGELKGKRLGCSKECGPGNCHGDVLVEMVKGV